MGSRVCGPPGTPAASQMRLLCTLKLTCTSVHVGTPSHLGHMDRVATTMPSQAHAGAAQEAPDIGQWEGQDVPLVSPSSCIVKGGIPSSRRYQPTYLTCTSLPSRGAARSRCGNSLYAFSCLASAKLPNKRLHRLTSSLVGLNNKRIIISNLCRTKFISMQTTKEFVSRLIHF